jgi:gluconolactonase
MLRLTTPARGCSSRQAPCGLRRRLLRRARWRPKPFNRGGLPPLPPGIGPLEPFADLHDSPQGKFLEGGAFDTDGNFWFVAIDTGWVSYLTPAKQLVPVFNCNPPAEFGLKCAPQGTSWHDGKLYLTTRHIGIIVYDPQTKKFSSVVSAYRNQRFKGPNDLDFDADGNLISPIRGALALGRSQRHDRAAYQYSKEGILRRIISTESVPNGIAVSPDNNTLAIAAN